jgi:hypothetical protein
MAGRRVDIPQAPPGFVVLHLKPEMVPLRWRLDRIVGYRWDAEALGTHLWVASRPQPFLIWEVPEELDALLGRGPPPEGPARPSRPRAVAAGRNGTRATREG